MRLYSIYFMCISKCFLINNTGNQSAYSLRGAQPRWFGYQAGLFLLPVTCFSINADLYWPQLIRYTMDILRLTKTTESIGVS